MLHHADKSSHSECPCRNGGLCAPTGKYCQCLHGFTGVLCEMPLGKWIIDE